MGEHTPGPWKIDWNISRLDIFSADAATLVSTLRRSALSSGIDETAKANARLIAAAPTQHAEMLRYLPVLERAEADSELWARLTDGLGIATLNGYRAAIAKATGEQE